MTSFRARVHLRALGTALGAAGTLAMLTSLPKFNLQGQTDASSTVPTCPWLSSLGESFDQRRQAGCPAPRHLNPSFNVSSLICRCRGESREKHKGRRDNQSPVAQDVEKRALQRAWICFQATSTITSITSSSFGGAHIPAAP